MQPHDKHFLIIGAIEDPDVATFRKNLGVAPEIVVVKLFSRRLFEAGDSATLRVESRHHVLDGPVFARRSETQITVECLRQDALPLDACQKRVPPSNSSRSSWPV